MSTDPIDRLTVIVDELREERGRLRAQNGTAQMEIHQLRRRLARTEAAYREVDELNQQLKKHVEAADQRAEQSRRAMADHSART